MLGGQPEGAADVLGSLPGVVSVRGDVGDGPESTFHLECDRTADVREPIFRAAVENGWVLLGLGEEKASLEDVFVRLTTHDRAADVVEEPAHPVEEVVQ